MDRAHEKLIKRRELMRADISSLRRLIRNQELTIAKARKYTIRDTEKAETLRTQVERKQAALRQARLRLGAANDRRLARAQEVGIFLLARPAQADQHVPGL